MSRNSAFFSDEYLVIPQYIQGITLGVTMIGIGAGLFRLSFRKVLQKPKCLAIGLFNHFIVSPVLVLIISKLFGSSSTFTAALTVSCLSPIGTSSILFTWAASADVALSWLLVLISTILSYLLTTPLSSLYLSYLLPDKSIDPIPVDTTVYMWSTIILVVPLAIGFIARQSSYNLGNSLISLSYFTSLLFAIVWVGAPFINTTSLALLSDSNLSISLATLVFLLISYITGYIAALIGRLPLHQRRSIALTTGTHNFTLSMYNIVLGLEDKDSQLNFKLIAESVLLISMLYTCIIAILFSFFARSFLTNSYQEGSHGLGLDTKAKSEKEAYLDSLFAAIKG